MKLNETKQEHKDVELLLKALDRNEHDEYQIVLSGVILHKVDLVIEKPPKWFAVDMDEAKKIGASLL